MKALNVCDSYKFCTHALVKQYCWFIKTEEKQNIMQIKISV